MYYFDAMGSIPTDVAGWTSNTNDTTTGMLTDIFSCEYLLEHFQNMLNFWNNNREWK